MSKQAFKRMRKVLGLEVAAVDTQVEMPQVPSAALLELRAWAESVLA